MNALDIALTVTFFPSPAAQTKTEEPYTPRALAERIRTVTAPHKDKLPWLKMARFGDQRTPTRPHSDGSGRMTGGSLRHDANVVAVTGIEADYDGGRVHIDEALSVLEKQGVAAILYTSPSHTEDTPRWRVLCPLAHEIPPARRGAMLGRLNGLFGGIFAAESWALSQSYYYGSVNYNPSHRVELIDGATIDDHEDLDAIWIGKAAGAGAPSSPTGTDTPGEARDDAELVRRIVTGEGYHVELCALAARYIARGMTIIAAANTLRGMMLARPDTTRDERWRDRYASVAGLVASAERKYRDDTAAARNSIARLIAKMNRAGAGVAEMRAAACAEAERQNLPPKVAFDLAEWMAKRPPCRRDDAHG